MKFQKFIEDLEAKGGISKTFQLILLASFLTNILTAGALFKRMDQEEKTIIIPPEINKSFWVDRKKLSPEYIEQMGVWVIQLHATVSPSSVDYNNTQLLKYVHPSVHGELAIRLQRGANRLKADNMSHVFNPREIVINEDGQALALVGTETTYIADKRVPNDKLKAYLVTFAYEDGKISIKELRETNPGRPFVDMTAKEIEAAEATDEESAGLRFENVPAQSDLPPPPPDPVQNVPQVEEALKTGVLPSIPANQ